MNYTDSMHPNFEEINFREFLDKNVNRVFENGRRFNGFKKKSEKEKPLI